MNVVSTISQKRPRFVCLYLHQLQKAEKMLQFSWKTLQLNDTMPGRVANLLSKKRLFMGCDLQRLFSCNDITYQCLLLFSNAFFSCIISSGFHISEQTVCTSTYCKSIQQAVWHNTGKRYHRRFSSGPVTVRSFQPNPCINFKFSEQLYQTGSGCWECL